MTLGLYVLLAGFSRVLVLFLYGFGVSMKLGKPGCGKGHKWQRHTHMATMKLSARWQAKIQSCFVLHGLSMFLID